ncbi:hypothetical protein ZIOFF_032861 [Zingiber officinale]|uniref:Uncharacterized protein n=1 Tax=Zingiber officinale TaxID=94328 RepID=A0A8J5GJI7_ZINOF|nr:hypothetical protein ZIOFF_032861 [Zingiber officinale]
MECLAFVILGTSDLSASSFPLSLVRRRRSASRFFDLYLASTGTSRTSLHQSPSAASTRSIAASVASLCRRGIGTAAASADPPVRLVAWPAIEGHLLRPHAPAACADGAGPIDRIKLEGIKALNNSDTVHHQLRLWLLVLLKNTLPLSARTQVSLATPAPTMHEKRNLTKAFFLKLVTDLCTVFFVVDFAAGGLMDFLIIIPQSRLHLPLIDHKRSPAPSTAPAIPGQSRESSSFDHAEKPAEPDTTAHHFGSSPSLPIHFMSNAYALCRQTGKIASPRGSFRLDDEQGNELHGWSFLIHKYMFNPDHNLQTYMIRKALLETTLDYDYGKANPIHDPKKGKPGPGTGGKP